MHGWDTRAPQVLTCEVSLPPFYPLLCTANELEDSQHGSGDTQTTPTASMLAAIAGTTLMDDVLEEDSTTIDLEAHCAALAGKEAGLLVLSGTMGNQVALRAHLTQPPHGVLCEYRSHIVKYEAGG